MTNSQRRKYGREVERINRRAEVRWQRPVQKAIQTKAKAVIARLRDGGIEAATRYLMEDIGNPGLAAAVKRLYVEVGLIHAKRVNAELRKDEKIIIKRTGALGRNAEWIAFILEYLERNLTSNLTFNMGATTRDALMLAIRKGVADGKGVDDIIALLEDWPYARFQAARIIRTEINRAANVGTQAAGSTFEYEQQKEWIAAKDSRTRGNPINGQKDHANHWQLDGIVVDEMGAFIDPRNGDRLQFPGDPAASAASVINCRCSAALTGKRDENGRLIPKKRLSRVTVIMPGQNSNNRRIVTI